MEHIAMTNTLTYLSSAVYFKLASLNYRAFDTLQSFAMANTLAYLRVASVPKVKKSYIVLTPGK
jgi:hypothetical protein